MAAEDRETSARQETAGGDEGQEESNGSNGGEGTGQTLAHELRQVVRDATLEVLGPAARQATSSAAKYAVKKGPELVRDNVMPAVDKAGGAGGLAQQVMSKGGEALSQSGGVGGMAGKLMSKLGGGGKKGASATGYGQGRRIMVQQHQYIPVNVEDVYKAWTESEWPEYMHRVNTLDRQMEEDSGRYAIGVKGLWFNKNFTAQIQEMVPFKFIVWSTIQGNIKNTGRVSFHGEGDDLTLMILNLDLAPSGLREKWVRGFRYHKRGIRSDFHRFSAWVQMRTQDELDDLEGWLGTIEGGKVTQSHEQYLEEHPDEEQDQEGTEEEEGQEEGQEEPEGEDEQEEPEGEHDEDEEPEGEDEQEEPEGEHDEDEEPEGEDEQEEPEGEHDEDEEPEGEDEQEEPEGEYEEAEEPEGEAEEEPEAATDTDEGAVSDEEDERPARRRQSRQRRSQQDEQADRPRRGEPRRRKQPRADADDGSETATGSSRRRRPAGQRSRG